MSRVTTRLTRSLPIATALLVTAVGLLAYGKLVSEPIAKPEATATIVANHIAQSLSDDLEVELITLKPEGFEPSEIVRPKGPFVLLVDDRSGKEGSSLRLQRLLGERLRDVNTTRRKSEWYDLIDLPPGDYVLSDAENATKRCRITLRP